MSYTIYFLNVKKKKNEGYLILVQPDFKHEMYRKCHGVVITK